MAFKKIILMDIYEIIRRWHGKQNICSISQVTGYDRKTIRRYVNAAKSLGLSEDKDLPDKEDITSLLKGVVNERTYVQPAREILFLYRDEIIDLIVNSEYKLLPKIAFEVICTKHDLFEKVSYSSFKRFFRIQCQNGSSVKTTCRIETPPGRIVQIDYAKMGLLYDRLTDKRRTVYAFIATLSFSRHKYVEFVFKQDAKSFVRSHINMMHHFNGVPEIILIDNLKSGVVKPDLYDPHFNRLYREMAEHYGCFIDPCRVGKAQDKAKVERDVQTIRQQFGKFKALDPSLDIAGANRQIAHWIIQKYGQKEHGTTGEKPYPVFVGEEKAKLKALPFKSFELAEWKAAKVHPDCYIQYRMKSFSVPNRFAGKHVWIKATDKILSVYHDEELIKQHLITDKKRHTDFNDFPENVRAVLDEGVPNILLTKAAMVGKNFRTLIFDTLKVHAFLNLRRAQGLLALKDKYPHHELEKVAGHVLDNNIVITPKQFKHLLISFSEFKENTTGLPLSDLTKTFVRDGTYFDHSS
jgi:transposase